MDESKLRKQRQTNTNELGRCLCSAATVCWLWTYGNGNSGQTAATYVCLRRGPRDRGGIFDLRLSDRVGGHAINLSSSKFQCLIWMNSVGAPRFENSNDKKKTRIVTLSFSSKMGICIYNSYKNCKYVLCTCFDVLGRKYCCAKNTHTIFRHFLRKVTKNGAQDKSAAIKMTDRALKMTNEWGGLVLVKKKLSGQLIHI